jgi:hypothetical protein
MPQMAKSGSARMQPLPPTQAALSIGMATFVFHDGLTDKQIRSFPITSMLKSRYSDGLDGGKLHNRDVLPHMLSFSALRRKLASKLGCGNFNPATTVIWDAVQDLRITDDEDLQSAVLQQLEAKRLDAVQLQLRKIKAPKRKRDGDEKAEGKVKKHHQDNEPQPITQQVDATKSKKAKKSRKDRKTQARLDAQLMLREIQDKMSEELFSDEDQDVYVSVIMKRLESEKIH